MKKVLFIDRDGTLTREPEDEQIDSFEKLVFYPGALFYLARIASELDFELVMVTNQDGLGTPSFPEEDFHPVHNFIVQTFANEGVVFDKQFIDPSFPEDNSPDRKPRTGLLQGYFSEEYDLGGSFVIGDRMTDIELANWWALLILFPAGEALSRAWRGYQDAGQRLSADARRPLFIGVVLILVAVTFLLELDWIVFGPVLIILAGVGLLLTSSASG